MKFLAQTASAHISVHLGSDSLMACEVERRWGLRQLTRKASFQFTGDDRALAMKRLSDWIGVGPRRRTLGWVIGPSEARYFILPWSPASVSPTMRDSYARARYEQIYECDASQAAFSFARPSESGEQLVSCVDLALTKELRAHAQSSGCQLQSIRPSLAAVWDTFRDVLEAEEGTLCLVDGDQQAIVRHNRQRIEHVQLVKRTTAAALRDASAGVLRRFSNIDTPRAASDLRLPRWANSPGEQHARYAFALCGAL